MHNFYCTLNEERKERATGRRLLLKPTASLIERASQQNELMAQAKETATNEPAKAEWSVFLHVQDILAASAWLRQDDRTGEHQQQLFWLLLQYCLAAINLPLIPFRCTGLASLLFKS